MIAQKNLPLDKALELGEKYGYEPDMITRMNPILIHAPLGAYLARELFDIDDPEILDAIAWHTTGRKNMTLLEKNNMPCRFYRRRTKL